MTEHKMNISDKVARLRHTELFGELNPTSLRKIAEMMDTVSYSPGDIIFNEGDEGDSFYILTSGLLRVERKTKHGKDILGEIHKGGFFGEFALLESTPRSATIEVLSPSTLLTLSGSDLLSLFIKNSTLESSIKTVLDRRKKAGGQPVPPPQSEIKKVITTFFSDLDQESIDTISDEFEWLWLPNGQQLIKEGESGDALYFLLKGQLRVTTDKKGSEFFIGITAPGEWVGEMSLISDNPHSANVSATTSSELLRLKRSDFNKLIEEYSHLTGKFSQLIQSRISQRVRFEQSIQPENRRQSLTLQLCEDTIRTEDLIVRNYKITDGYHRLALDLADVLGATDVNWPAFGAHASKSAGFTIRKEEIDSSYLGKLLYSGPGKKITPKQIECFMNETIEWVSESISDGNLRIFGDMAPVIVRFIEFMKTDQKNDRSNMLAFLNTLVPGKSEHDGQDLLGQALLAWYDASIEDSPKRTSELMLLGNARMGLHEQIRIQPDIEQALGAPLKNRIGDEFSINIEKWSSNFPSFIKSRLNNSTGRLEHKVMDNLQSFIRKIITKRMMMLRLPDLNLKLSSDVPALDESLVYPLTLKSLSEPELIQLFKKYTLNESDVSGSGAADWVSLHDRMNFILHLFRSHQQNHALYNIPLTHDEISLIEY